MVQFRGKEMMQEDLDQISLPSGYWLNEYCIRQVLGQGGFGITYLAHDQRLDRDVAIKEFMPGSLAIRQAGSTVIPRSTAARQDYKGGLERFLKEARILARLSHQNIVRVLTLFEANGTAYIVMCHEAGESLADRLKARGGVLPAGELLAIAEPLLDGLAAVHKAGFLHRDIKPSNIFLRANGDPVLLDFGTARQAVGAMSRSLVSILTPGYAPIEQYHVQGDQGPWTDIYGMGAVLYSCISGRVPPDAPARAQAGMDRQPDPLRPARLVGQGRYPAPFLAAIDRSLAVLPKERLRSVDDLRQALIASRVTAPGAGRYRPAQRSWLDGRWPAWVAGGGAVLLAMAILVLLLREPAEQARPADQGHAAPPPIVSEPPRPAPPSPPAVPEPPAPAPPPPPAEAPATPPLEREPVSPPAPAGPDANGAEGKTPPAHSEEGNSPPRRARGGQGAPPPHAGTTSPCSTTSASGWSIVKKC